MAMDDKKQMSVGPYEVVRSALTSWAEAELAALNAARNPKLQYQSAVEAAEDAPANSDTGTEVEGALYALFQVLVRRDSSTKTCKVQVDTLDNSQTWTVTLAGTDFDFVSDADTTAAEVLNGLQALIDADAAYSAEVNVAEDELTITGADDDDYTIAVSVTGGTGVLTTDGSDASSVTIRGWYKPVGASEATDPWLDMEGREEIVSRNTGFRLDVSGMAEILGQVVATDGRTIIGCAPCGLTTQEAASWPTS